MPIRRLPSDGAAANVYTLMEAIDAFPPVLQRAESAFDQLAGSVTASLDRIDAAIETLDRLGRSGGSGSVPQSGSPYLQEASLTLFDDEIRTAREERLDLEAGIVETLVAQNAETERIADSQERAASATHAAWSTLSDDIVGDFDRAFAGISSSGQEAFSGLWREMASEFSSALSGMDWTGIFGTSGGRIASAATGLLSSGGGGIFDAASSLLTSFLPTSTGLSTGLASSLGSGSSIVSSLLGGSGLLPVSAIASIAVAGLSELFKDEDYPFAKAVIGIDQGQAVDESSFELDGGPLDEIRELQSRVIDTLDAISEAIGTGFDGSAPNFLQIGYSSGRKDGLPSGFFVSGLEATGDFTTGADLTGIEDEEEVIGRAVELAFAKAARDGTLTGVSGSGERAEKIFADGMERLLAAPFEDLETSLRRIDFLASFEETVALYQENGAVLDSYTRGLRAQKAALEESADALAESSLAPVQTFLSDAAAAFGTVTDGLDIDQASLTEAGTAVQGMVSDLLEAASLSGTEEPLEGYALLYAQQAAEIAALVPGLEALNEQLSALGLETIDVAARVAEANAALTAEVQSQFISALDAALSPDHASAIEALEERDSLLLQAEQLGLGNDASVTARIDSLLESRLDALGFALDESGELVESFSASIEDATAGIERQLSAQEDVVEDFTRLAESLAEARLDLALDSSLSPYAPLDRLSTAQSEFERLAAASADGDLEAREDLADAARDYLGIAREIYASGEAYTEIFRDVDAVLESALGSTEAQVSTAQRQLDVLIEIRDRLDVSDSSGGITGYLASSGGQYSANGGSIVASGYDLGYDPETNIAILTALDAAGLPLPSGFGEGQLARLRQQNAAVDAVVSAMGFANGGIMTSEGPASLSAYEGGISQATSVAIFGEGSLPEAYVPLPDGRSIPVSLSQPANDGGDRENTEAMRQQRSDSRELLRELKRLNAEVTSLRTDNERLSRVLGRAFSRQSA